MQVYFAANNPSSFYKRTSLAGTMSTNSAYFDSAVVSSAIQLNLSQEYIETPRFEPQTSVWIHFDLVCIFPLSNSTMIELMSSTLIPVIRLRRDATTEFFNVQFWNGTTWTSIGAAPSWAGIGSPRYTMDLRVSCGVAGSFDLYMGGILVSTGSGLHAAVTNIASVRFYAAGTNTGLSQILIADVDTRDAKILSRIPNSNGFFTDGTGSFSDVNNKDGNDGTAINLTSIGQKRTVVSEISTITSGYIVDTVFVTARVRVAGGIVTDAYGIWRLGTTNVSSPLLGVAASYEPRTYKLTVSPTTGLTITNSELNSLQFGVEAV